MTGSFDSVAAVLDVVQRLLTITEAVIQTFETGRNPNPSDLRDVHTEAKQIMATIAEKRAQGGN